MSGTDGTGHPVIAYLTGDFPKVSHTFILREVTALRALGLEIRTCSIRMPADSEIKGAAERQAREDTFYVLAAAKNPLRLARAHLSALRFSPRRWFGALALAWHTRSPGAKAALWQLFYFLEAGILAAELRRSGAAHLHNHFVDSSCSVAMLASHMSGVPYSFTLHGPTELYEPHRWRLDEKIARAGFSAYISHFARSQGMLFSDPAHWDRMRIVHCGVEPQRYRRAPDGKTTSEIVFIGRMAGVKGAPLMIAALQRLRATYPEVRLVMIGDGPERPTLQAQARAAGLDDAIEFTGYLDQDEVAERLSQAALLALPSFAEGVPVVLMEAMATGIPVITTRIAGIPELVEHDVSGLLVPPGDLEGLIDALSTLLKDPDLRTRMGAAGRAKILRDFDLGTEARWLAKLFHASLAGDLPETLRPAERDVSQSGSAS